MIAVLNVPLRVNAEQRVRLERLQQLFSRTCNELARLVQETRCWNRVAVHHLAYHRLREKFPELGSQMVCNAIYSVCRAARLVYQGAGSPWNVLSSPTATLPRLMFSEGSPVFFDRHTLSLKDGRLSMYTLDGRIHVHVCLDKIDENRICHDRLKEVLLKATSDGYVLQFVFVGEAELSAVPNELPSYLAVMNSDLLNQGYAVLGSDFS